VKAKTKFMKMYYKLPTEARLLIWDPYGATPMTLSIIRLEIAKDTKLGRELLKDLGFKDDR
jgi:hypothetical protein